MRDYLRWHDGYDDPDSGLPWRLAKVQGYLTAELDARPGPLRVVSACAGDGRDLLGVLAGRDDASRVTATLVELHPELATSARSAAASLASIVEVREADAGHTGSYVGALPADIVLLVGIFGNVADTDIDRTVDAVPGFCAPDALVVWSRGLTRHPDNDGIRARFTALGCTELDYAERPTDKGRTAIGAMRFGDVPQPLPPRTVLFSFER